MRVVLLGSGGPEMTLRRAGYATLIEAGGQRLLFDAGRGVLQRLYESRVDPASIRNIFFTHLHSDHIEGLPGVWITPWYLLGRTRPLHIWGPAGTWKMVAGMESMYGHDIEKRVNRWNTWESLKPLVREIAEGDIYDEEGLRVSAFAVSHGDGNPAFGYRISYRGKNVLLSGDTTYSENVVKYGRDADLIVHNVIAMGPAYSAIPEARAIQAMLATPEQAALVFKKIRPKMAVYSHIVKKGLPGAAGDRIIMTRTRDAGYLGPLAMGCDRMAIEIGDTVRVIPPEAIDDLPDMDFKAAKVGMPPSHSDAPLDASSASQSMQK
ncbi:MAG TPA: MBL fold metallo-hydrolase [Herbaspirillum sp.]